MWLLAGLGNPGPRYAGNRHNAGFMALDAIAEHYGARGYASKFQGQWGEVSIGGERAFLLKPLTFMNLSGQAIGEALRFYKLPLARLVVLHDELDLPTLRLRAKQGGGHGGHNGLKSIDAHCGADYWRVRLGIGHPGTPEAVTDYVLSDFSSPELPGMKKLFSATAAAIPLLLEGQDAAFMNKVTLAMKA